MFEVWTPLQRVDRIAAISAHIETKLAAIRAHRSQCEIVRFDEAVRRLARYQGEMHSWSGGDYTQISARLSS